MPPSSSSSRPDRPTSMSWRAASPRACAAGVVASAGLAAGAFVHVIGAAAGLSIIFQYSPVAYTILKIVGAVYLIWLGITQIMSSRDAAPDMQDIPAPAHRTDRRILVESALVEVLNPKVALFFLAFLPQFVDAAAGFRRGSVPGAGRDVHGRGLRLRPRLCDRRRTRSDRNARKPHRPAHSGLGVGLPVDRSRRLHGVQRQGLTSAQTPNAFLHALTATWRNCSAAAP